MRGGSAFLVLVALACSPGVARPQRDATSRAALQNRATAEPTAARSGTAERGATAERSATAVVAGYSHSCALMSDATVRCWGANERGQLGAPAPNACLLATTIPTLGANVPLSCRATAASVGLTDVVQLAASADTTCALLRDRSVRCWGGNTYAVVGDGSTTDRAQPTAVAGLARVAQIAVGPKHACARLEDDTIECWGNNFYGQMGPLSREVSPAEVSGRGDTSVLELAPRRLQMGAAVEVAVGERLTCARLRSGDVACLGQGTHTWGLSPPTAQVLPTASGATALALGNVNHCVLMAGGEARCWGANIGGGLLDGTRTPQRAPVASVNLPRVSSVVMSPATFACAVVAADGQVQCWGDPSPASDQLRRIDVPVPVAQLALGNRHGCAVARDGSVFCWGDGFWGQTGSAEELGREAATFWSAPRRFAL